MRMLCLRKGSGDQLLALALHESTTPSLVLRKAWFNCTMQEKEPIICALHCQLFKPRMGMSRQAL